MSTLHLLPVATWGQRNLPEPNLEARPSGFYSLSRDGDSGTARLSRGRVLVRPCVSIRCREMGTAELGAVTGIDDPLRFYSLPRDGDSGTKRALASIRGGLEFLFAVARWGQRNAYMVMGDDDLPRMFLFAVARGGQRNAAGGRTTDDLLVVFLFAVARWGQRNLPTWTVGRRWLRFYSLSRDGDSGTPGRDPHRQDRVPVSIRCREMGTAEQVARRVQARGGSCFYALSRDGDSGTPAFFLHTTTQRQSGVSIRCREMGTAELGLGRTDGLTKRFYSLSRDGDSGTPQDLSGSSTFRVMGWGGHAAIRAAL